MATKNAAPKKTTDKKTATTKDFFIYDLANKKMVKAESAKEVTFSGFNDFGFFLHKAKPKGWAISEAVSGSRIANGATQAQTKSEARAALKKAGKEKLIELIKIATDQNGPANKDAKLPEIKILKPKKPVAKKTVKKVEPKPVVKVSENIITTTKQEPQEPPVSRRGSRSKGKMSMIDAAAEILAKTKEPLTVKDITQAIFKEGLCQSEGRTPHATLAAAIGREITNKGKQSRFRRVDRGLFELNM